MGNCWIFIFLGYKANITYTVVVQGGNAESVTVTVKDRNSTDVAHSNKLHDSLTLNNAHLWWPYTESHEFGYLYTLEVWYTFYLTFCFHLGVC